LAGFNGHSVEEDVGVLEADDRVLGGEEDAFCALDEVEIVVAWLDEIGVAY